VRNGRVPVKKPKVWWFFTYKDLINHKSVFSFLVQIITSLRKGWEGMYTKHIETWLNPKMFKTIVGENKYFGHVKEILWSN